MKKSLLILSLLVLTNLWQTSQVQAGPRERARARARWNYSSQNYSSASTMPAPSPRFSGPGPYTPAVEALAEVNAARAARGLPPYVLEPTLSEAASVCANLRAQHLLAGHTANDFAALPPGSYADAAGCGGLEPSWGWGSCCTYDNYRYAGAAYAVGRDGKRYMHLFVRR